MKYPSPTDIAEMKARGYEPETIRMAEERSELWHRTQALCERIRVAFAGVRLGHGVGLKQAQGIDGYEGEAVCLAYRQQDEQEDWSRIPVKDLNSCHSSLSFFDDEGMRFHLPAFLIAELQEQYDHGMAFQLGYLSDLSMRQYALLNAAQREVVRDVALFLADDEDHSFDRPQLLRAIDEYWSR
jgi:hypothetical protein